MVNRPTVGGTRQRHFDGTNLKPRELPENAPTPTRRMHVADCRNRDARCGAVLGGVLRKLRNIKCLPF